MQHKTSYYSTKSIQIKLLGCGKCGKLFKQEMDLFSCFGLLGMSLFLGGNLGITPLFPLLHLLLPEQKKPRSLVQMEHSCLLCPAVAPGSPAEKTKQTIPLEADTGDSGRVRHTAFLKHPCKSGHPYATPSTFFRKRVETFLPCFDSGQINSTLFKEQDIRARCCWGFLPFKNARSGQGYSEGSQSSQSTPLPWEVCSQQCLAPSHPAAQSPSRAEGISPANLCSLRLCCKPGFLCGLFSKMRLSAHCLKEAQQLHKPLSLHRAQQQSMPRLPFVLADLSLTVPWRIGAEQPFSCLRTSQRSFGTGHYILPHSSQHLAWK